MALKYRQQIKKQAIVKIKVRPNYVMTDIPENYIERDLQSSLKPFIFLQAMTGASKYKLKDGFITSNGFRYDIVSVIATFVLVNAIIYYRIANDFNYASVGHLITFSFGILVNWFSNIILKHRNILLVITIQKLCRSLNIETSFFKRFTFHNWMCVIAINVYFAFLIFESFYIFRFPLLYLAAFFYVYILFDINISYATAVLKLLRGCLKSWLKEIKKTGFSEEWVHDHFWDKMFSTYMDILEVYQLIRNSLGPHVSFLCNNSKHSLICDQYTFADLSVSNSILFIYFRSLIS